MTHSVLSSRPGLALLAGVGIALACLGAPSNAAPTEPVSSPTFKVFVKQPGVYAVEFDDLLAAGHDGSPLASAGLGLRQAGEPVPIWIEDGDDGRFDPGDRLIFVGEHLAGEHSNFSEYSAVNVYVLESRATEPARSVPSGAVSSEWCDDRAPLSARVRVERDEMRMRFSDHGGSRQEIWYQAKLTQIDKEPYRVPLDLADLARSRQRSVTLRVHLRGWSRLPRELATLAPDHRVEVSLNREVVGSVEWNNSTRGQLLELTLPSTMFDPGEDELTLRVPKRRIGEEKRAQVDVVMLNWIELTYPRDSLVGVEQASMFLDREVSPACVDLRVPAESTFAVYGASGWRVASGDTTGIRTQPTADGGEIAALSLVREQAWPAYEPFWVTLDGAALSPLSVSVDRPSDLRGVTRQADYLIIAHPTLADAVQPLAEFHRERGLSVEVIDVDDVYDEFNFGIVHPSAIHAFLSHAWHDWARPAPRFVLLVGDASWDASHERIVDKNYADKVFSIKHRTRLPRNEFTPYDDAPESNDRNLIPTWSTPTRAGHAANDNRLVDVTGRDGRPEMAIGRFPVSEPSEVSAIVDKTIRYARETGVGPWKRRVLWITNDQRFYQDQSDRLSVTMATRGFESAKVYPAPEEPSNEQHRETLIQAFNEGQLLVHFFGHGGRYIWRTGPPDLKKNHDLFTLDDLDSLEPSSRLPIVLSMTCYSAPFDHPSADSIGEKFLRLPDRGAVAVIAAAWRNSPSFQMSHSLMDELTRPGTIGEAFMRAKIETRSTDFVQQYNLLGDPAAPIALPRLALDVEWIEGDAPEVRATIDGTKFGGQAIVDWIGEGGRVVHTQRTEARRGKLQAAFDGDPAQAAGVTAASVYVWDERGGRDGIGGAAPERKQKPGPSNPKQARSAVSPADAGDTKEPGQ